MQKKFKVGNEKWIWDISSFLSSVMPYSLEFKVLLAMSLVMIEQSLFKCLLTHYQQMEHTQLQLFTCKFTLKKKNSMEKKLDAAKRILHEKPFSVSLHSITRTHEITD